MKDKYYKKLEKKCRGKLTQEQVDFNLEMIATEDEDYIRLFQEGLIANNDLIDLLTGIPLLSCLKVYEIISKYPSAIRIILRELLMKLAKLEVDGGWLPTPENINALPEPVRQFIHDLETNTDPAHIVRENILIKDTCRSLLLKLEEKRKVTEGWIQKMAEDTASDYPYVAFPNLITIFKKLLKEAGIKVVKK